MLRLLRHTRVPAVLALLLVGGSVPISVAALLHDADDADCQPVLVQHDQRAHRVGGARTIPDVPQHCAVCHWLQSLQTIVTTESTAAAATAVARLSIPPLVLGATQSSGEIPARAPPHA